MGSRDVFGLAPSRILLKKATILDASKRTGYPVQEIIAEINKMVDKHIA